MQRNEIADFIDRNNLKDPDYAHVLLHSLAGIYHHTPYPVRDKRLRR